MKSKIKNLSFKTNARHIGQLGRELVTDFVTALVELIKNSYDADAECISISIENTKELSSRIIIADTGSGMTQEDFEKKWMMIGTSNKISDPYTKNGRKKAGKKGIGRFSVERLAGKVKIYSFPEEEAPFSVEVNWNKFEELDIEALKQRTEQLRNEPDSSAGKYIAAQLEYFFLLPDVEEDDKSKITTLLGEDFYDYRKYFDKDILHIFEKKVIPVLKKYEGTQQLVEDIQSPLIELESPEECEYYSALLELYERKKINRRNTGLIMVLEGVRDEWNQKSIDKLQKELRLLVAPDFLEEDPFAIYLYADEFKVENEISVNEIIDLSFAHIEAAVIDNGTGGVIHYQDKEGNIKDVNVEFDTPQLCGDFTFDLHFFLRDGAHMGIGSYNTRFANRILDTYCGVKIYRDNFRVKPYGDLGNDWLFLDQSKVSETHGYLVGNNQTIGRVNISDIGNPLLIDATNREGIIENLAYEQMRDFIQYSIKLISEVRKKKIEEKEAEKRRLEEERQRILAEQEELKEGKKELDELEDLIAKESVDTEGQKFELLTNYVEKNREYHKQQEEYQKKYEKNAEKRYDNVQELLDLQQSELNMYKNLATLGMLASEFGHETSDIINRVNNSLTVVERHIRDKVNMETPMRMLDIAKNDFDRISSYSNMIIAFLRRKKREKTEVIKFEPILDEVCGYYIKILDEFNIKLQYYCEDDISYKMKQIDLESIIINMITNAYAQLKKCRERYINIEIYEDDKLITMSFEDTGPGVPEVERENIFKAFVSTKEDGIGLGLNIISGIVQQYGGDVKCEKSLKYGGACFYVFFRKEGEDS